MARDALNAIRTQYSKVHCLLRSWQDDDIGCIVEVGALEKTFRARSAYQVGAWSIPTEHAEKRLTDNLMDSVAQRDGSKELLRCTTGARLF